VQSLAGLDYAGRNRHLDVCFSALKRRAWQPIPETEASFYFNAIKASALASKKRPRKPRRPFEVDSADHNIPPARMFVNIFNDHEYDKFPKSRLAIHVLGGSLGYHAKFQKERSRLDLLGGADHNRSSFSTR
jgi:hypothetical protein